MIANQDDSQGNALRVSYLVPVTHPSIHHLLHHLITVTNVLVKEGAFDSEDCCTHLREKHWVAVDKVEINPKALADCVPDPFLHPLHSPWVLCKPSATPICLGSLGVCDLDTGFSLGFKGLGQFGLFSLTILLFSLSIVS